MDNFIDPARKPQEIIGPEIETGRTQRTFDHFQTLTVSGREPEPVEQLIDALPGAQTLEGPRKKDHPMALFQELDRQMASQKPGSAGDEKYRLAIHAPPEDFV